MITGIKQVGPPTMLGPARPGKLLAQLRRDLLAHYKAGHKHAAKCVAEKQLAEVHVWLAGKAALEARRALPADQEFGQWVESCGKEVSHTTIWRWMKLVESFESKLPLLTTISTGGCEQRVMKLLAGEIAAATDGKTRRQLELDLGLRTAGGKRKAKMFCFSCKQEVPNKHDACPHCGIDPFATHDAECKTAAVVRVFKFVEQFKNVGDWPLDDKTGGMLVMALITALDDLGVLTETGELTLDGETVTKATVKAWRESEQRRADLCLS